jgi:hypothetical protein
MVMIMAKRRKRRKQQSQGFDMMDDTINNPTVAFVDEDDGNNYGMVDCAILSKVERVNHDSTISSNPTTQAKPLCS